MHHGHGNIAAAQCVEGAVIRHIFIEGIQPGGVEVNGVYFPARNENDVVVYEAQPAEYGLIIHRVLAKINASDGVFYLTKGDNNAAADQQSGISLVPESAVKGRVIGRIPFIGYFKLLLFLQFDFPPGCDRNLKYLD